MGGVSRRFVPLYSDPWPESALHARPALTVPLREALLSVVGNASGLLAQAMLVAVGLGAVMAASTRAFLIVKVTGAVYVVWLGVQAIRHRSDARRALLSGERPPERVGAALMTAFVVGITNPKTVAAAGLDDRISVASGDFFAGPLPKAEVVTMGLILHDWNLERKLHLIRAAYEALPDGGAYIVIENLIDNARRENAFGLMMSLNMLIEFGDAFDFTGADFAGWCREVGFREVEVLPLTGPASAAVAYK
jgi:hypothetical protein